jgi:hypothetical protein
VQQRVDGLDNGANVGLGAGSPNSDPPRFFGQLPGEMNRDHQDGNLGKKPINLPRDVETIQVWHLEVEQNHVRGILLHPLNCFPSRSSLVANLPSTLLFEESAQVVSDRRIVVYNKNANQSARPSAVARMTLVALRMVKK